MEKLKPAIGSIKNKKRVGRGPSSGIGKTCARGHKGQKSRKGGTIRLGFEGGQTPLYRRLPKRGFKNSRFVKEYKEINLFMLNSFKDGSVINLDDYIEHKLLDSKNTRIKILGNGDLNKKLEVYANKFTKGAKEKIEKAGGKTIIIKAEKIKEQTSNKTKKAEEKKSEEKKSGVQKPKVEKKVEDKKNIEQKPKKDEKKDEKKENK
jgi:large subunit ribosomal protein L15